MSLSRFLKEPLLHFVLIGAALFAIHAGINPSSRKDSEGTIVVSAGRIEQLAAIFAKTWQRAPTAEELKGLIDDFVLEEAYYRKAVEMGIDQDDTMIRRRLRQKLEFLTDDTVALATPSDADLARYLSEHPGDFRTDPTYTFRQVFFNPGKHGADPLPEIRKRADELRAGGEVTGDATLLPEGLEKATSQTIDGTFGTGFAQKLAELQPGIWSDPIPSAFGLHLVRVEETTPGELPSLEKIRPIVEREWANLRRTEARATFNAALLKGIEVEVEWPESGKAPEVDK
ncbi:MAG: peptidyl-prolyl cis-trans isomerase [Verrucomicrobiales bacterium]|nr:peptidyl-prolyl cis-trans isomerase [Verrucomicrobiae bacterium]MCP5552014.1 peptidyl-prolyl cis-trans isomerase [Akkermansiaceae bacterium]HRX54783.1 peptidyl-prolyl cis-trans isomerase [Verrucomicrobiales bacterium]